MAKETQTPRAGATSPDENKAIARRLIRAFDDEDLDAFSQLLAPDFRYRQNGKTEEGVEGFRAMARRVYAAWKPHRLEIADEIAEGDRVVLRMVAHDTHSGPYRGLAPTGAELTWSLMFIFLIVDGRIREIWRAGDDVVRFEQVGLRVVAP